MRVLNQITFEARDDAEALRLAGERLGKEAVILSSRIVYVGGFMGLFRRRALMITAGILQEDPKEEKPKERESEVTSRESLRAFQKLLEFKQATDAKNMGATPQAPVNPHVAANPREGELMPPQPETLDTAKIIYSPTAPSVVSGRAVQEYDSIHISSAGRGSVIPEKAVLEKPAPAKRDDDDAGALRDEVTNLSKRLDDVLRRLEEMGDEGPDFSGKRGVERSFRGGLPGIAVEPREEQIEKDELYDRLISAEVEADYARQIVNEYRGQKGSVPFVKWIASKVRCSDPLNVLGGRKVMLLGSTGVGKTTTIAKLAAIQALWEHKNVLLLTSDTYRIAAVDQLRTYAKILGIPIEVIFEGENISRILEEHASADLMLLDTAGRGHRDRKNLETLEVVYDTFKPDAVHLVLAANMKYKDMLDIVDRMSVVPVSHLIFTKLDETVSYGALFNMLKTLDCPVSFFTTGQNVPNDIEVASGDRLAGLLMGDEVRAVHRE
ncbi:MAG: flagellar biosynthesis protein FlhF [Synergistaceae bacterium]|nr:flagellar biosynthesis protein FlhF [Synergistaceae bacterium]